MNNISYRIRTNVGEDKKINLQIDSDYDVLEILSLKISTEDAYKLHTSSYGCVVGRVLANGGVGIPNAKVSIFIEVDTETQENEVLYNLYPYNTTATKNSDSIRYNLLPDEQVRKCHQPIGTMPNKRLTLDENNVLEVFDKYYKFTTTTNNAGDYMIMGVPVGNQNIHVDIDLSDIGFLSQKPIDMIYKGYGTTQFENPQQFKKDVNIDSLAQVISQSTNVFVNAFWGDEEEGEISITRHDIDVDYKFEPTCIFMGSVVTDAVSNGISKNCIPTGNMGRMDRLVTGNGTIEMIRKTPDGGVEEHSVQGTEVIDGNGVWCYQIPMNLDYITTDEYGNIIPTDNTEKGIPTRTRVRFRVSLHGSENSEVNSHLVKVLVPNNPHEGSEVDYAFGTNTIDNEEGSESYRDLLWNNVYSIKSFIPRIQKGNYQRTKKFTGMKNVNVYGNNNPVPYNNIRVNITFMFVLQCLIVKILLFLVKMLNKIFCAIIDVFEHAEICSEPFRGAQCLYMGDGMCPDLDGWYFAPGCRDTDNYTLPQDTIDRLHEAENGGDASSNTDRESIDNTNKDTVTYCITTSTDYFVQCVEINLAMEHEVIQFDFYNDWINGLIYIPRWFIHLRKKASFFFGLIKVAPKMKACLEDGFKQSRRYTQQCALSYMTSNKSGEVEYYTTSYNGCGHKTKYKCHKGGGRKHAYIFGGAKGGLIHKEQNHFVGENTSVYYAKPCEWVNSNNGRRKRCLLFATDIVLLGSISENNLWGIPFSVDQLVSSTFQMPPNLMHTNMDSDGALYGVTSSGKHYCSPTSESMRGEDEGPKAVEQTFSGYNKWANGTDSAKSNDDATYVEETNDTAVTEIAGIDWGISGPGQGSSDSSKLYNPGGHFLGIACVNSSVNIKSCVNLMRVCELGALMSQRLELVQRVSEKGATGGIVYDENGKYDYSYLIPTGLIANRELINSNYRSIFATLNANALRTRKNINKGFYEYVFRSSLPSGFNGELVGSIDMSKDGGYRNIPKESEQGIYKEYRYPEESLDLEYLLFRFGIDEGGDDIVTQLRKRHLIENDYGTVALPVFENSYYFYFGLVNGSTAYDKLLAEYYATCPSEDKTESIMLETKECIVCQKEGYLKYYLNDIPEPYRVKVHKDDEIIGKSTYMVGTENTVAVSDGGKYEVEIVNYKADINTKKSIYINAYLPEETIIYKGEEKHPLLYNGSVDVSVSEFRIAPLLSDGVHYVGDTRPAFVIEKMPYKFQEGYDGAFGPYPKTILIEKEVNGSWVEIDINEESIKCYSNNDAGAADEQKWGQMEGGNLVNNVYDFTTDTIVLYKDSTPDENGRVWMKVDCYEWGVGTYIIRIGYSCDNEDGMAYYTLGRYDVNFGYYHNPVECASNDEVACGTVYDSLNNCSDLASGDDIEMCNDPFGYDNGVVCDDALLGHTECIDPTGGENECWDPVGGNESE